MCKKRLKPSDSGLNLETIFIAFETMHNLNLRGRPVKIEQFKVGLSFFSDPTISPQYFKWNRSALICDNATMKF